MCKNCIEMKIDAETIEHWRKKGTYYGYPKCCIEAFIERSLKIIEDFSKRNELFTKNQLDITYGGYVPCVQCADKIVSNKLDISSLIENRICKTKFPIDE